MAQRIRLGEGTKSTVAMCLDGGGEVRRLRSYVKKDSRPEKVSETLPNRCLTY